MRRLLALLALPCVALVASFAQAAPLPVPPTNRAGIVVQWGNGQVASACVAFEGASINGLELLQRSGLQVTSENSAGSATVCKIERDGCAFPAEACFCQCKGGGTCRYWAYWHLAATGWQYSNVGAATYRVPPGGVDGWAWGNGSVATGTQPAAITFDQICQVPAASTASLPTQFPATPAQGRPVRPVGTAVREQNVVPTTTLPTVLMITQTTSLAAPTSVGDASVAGTSVSSDPTSALTSSVPTPLAAAAGTPSQPEASNATRTGTAQYLVFGALLAGLAVWIVAIRRRQA